jgi:hypothetical protein
MSQRFMGNASAQANAPLFRSDDNGRSALTLAMTIDALE